MRNIRLERDRSALCARDLRQSTASIEPSPSPPSPSLSNHSSNVMMSSNHLISTNSVVGGITSVPNNSVAITNQTNNAISNGTSINLPKRLRNYHDHFYKYYHHYHHYHHITLSLAPTKQLAISTKFSLLLLMQVQDV
ncbi:hypothetical protein TCAL_07044 [Tigriopus californicus]|uniref:Uncharacterized protein n=1 Tax=Tigriopus californicus TaxID=6832 RepID=A0A553PQP8_TIGCA|nr:hypothetical protein TCAL_07044 [Tigriopus californicus]|eukprot:TCALIF_07044-PA protein Name:"Protein of unknown function" AED:0.69 eAED:0.69 QI:0/0/0/0.33/1/1/3/0/137